MPIEYPKRPTRRDKAVEIGKAAAEAIPWAGPALKVLGIVLPSDIAADQERWQEEVTDQLNVLARQHARPTISKDSLAWLLALLAGKLDEDGTGEVFVKHTEWETRFSDASQTDVEDALAELVHAGWIQTQPDANSPLGIGGFCPTSLLFAHTHPWLHGLYPSADAAELAAFILNNAGADSAVSSVQIVNHYRWERRRLYPALAFLLDEVLPEDDVERYYQPDYPFCWIYLNGTTRRILREFISSTPS